MPAPQIIVAGAGIGGLAAALALSHSGYRVTVLERAIALEEAGAGVQLASNAVRALARLGVMERVTPLAVRPRSLRIYGGRSGHLLIEGPLGPDAVEHFGAPFFAIHRADLQQALLGAVNDDPNIELRLGRTMEDFISHEDSVTVRVSNAGITEEYIGAGLIGADGIRSTVRARLGVGREPSFRHRAAYRATVPMEQVPAALATPSVKLWMGPATHLVSYPVKAGKAMNLVAITVDQRASHGWGTNSPTGDVATLFARWAEQPRSLLALPENWLRWALHDLDPMKTWGKGPVTLLGDAAHAMLPFLAQGAAQALEDAVVLGQFLGTAEGNIPAALRRYETARIPRVTQIQKAARATDRLYHLSGPARLARDAVLQMKSGTALLERYGWIYRWMP